LLQVNANTQQQEKLQEKNEASTYQMEQQMRQSPGSVTQQQIDNKVPPLLRYIEAMLCLSMTCRQLLISAKGEAHPLEVSHHERVRLAVSRS